MSAHAVPTGLRDAAVAARTEAQRADTKATILATFALAGLGAVYTLGSRHLSGAASLVLWTSMVPIGAALLVLLLVIMPRLGKAPAPVGGWLDAARSAPSTMLDTWQQMDANVNGQLHLAHDVCVTSYIALVKYRWVRAAVVLLIFGGLQLALAGLIAAVTS
jgi:hypothetical protein